MKDKKRKDVLSIFNSLPLEVQDYFQKAFKQTSTLDGFLSALMVGNCPSCGSTKTRDCDESPLHDITVGICLDCHHMWCLECGYKLITWPCPHWEICDECAFTHKELVDDEGSRIEGAFEHLCQAELEPSDCPRIKEKMVD
jgi:hypothetical protein